MISEKDLLNGGQGAPLTPIFHQLIVQKKISLPVCILETEYQILLL